MDEEPIVNLTPLIDVLFVVLIAFMLVAPLLNSERVDLAEAGPKAEKRGGEEKLTITVKQDNSIWLGGKRVESGELKRVLTAEHLKRPHLKGPKLLQDQRASFGTYQTVKNCAEAAGFEELELVVKPG
jgi:biopolymer transport protein ExbD